MPKEFQFEGEEVLIRKVGRNVVLSPKEDPWSSLVQSPNLFTEDSNGRKTHPIPGGFQRVPEYCRTLDPETRTRPRSRVQAQEGRRRKPLEPRKVFEAIVYVLRTGIQWKALPRERYGSPSSIHAYFRKWEKAGFFYQLWLRGLAEYDEMEGVAWEWQSVDGAMMKAPLAQESVGRNPTDRGKKDPSAICRSTSVASLCRSS